MRCLTGCILLGGSDTFCETFDISMHIPQSLISSEKIVKVDATALAYSDDSLDELEAEITRVISHGGYGSVY